MYGCNAPSFRIPEEETTVYLQDHAILQGKLAKDTEIIRGSIVRMRGRVVVPDGLTLTIHKGVTILSDPTMLTYLVVMRGGRIVADGTKKHPITFTSGREKGRRYAQDWGGIIINGYAEINNSDYPDSRAVYNEGRGFADSGKYGGDENSYDSGRLSYVRIEFCGQRTAQNDHFPGLLLQGVGFHTDIDYVSIYNCGGNGISIYGGTVNLRHIVLIGNYGYQLFSDYGWRGKVQYAAVATIGPRGYWTLHRNNASDFSAEPMASVIYYNSSFIGPAHDVGFSLESGASAEIYNSYIGNAEAGNCFSITDSVLRLDSSRVDACSDDLSSNPDIAVDSNTVLYPAGDTFIAGLPATLQREQFVDVTTRIFDPTEASMIRNDKPLNGFFDTTFYTGSIRNSGSNWMSSWTKFPLQ